MSDLWCVHVYGWDEITAVGSRIEGLNRANFLNTMFAATRNTIDEGDTENIAVVERWPHSSETHAQAVIEARAADERNDMPPWG